MSGPKTTTVSLNASRARLRREQAEAAARALNAQRKAELAAAQRRAHDSHRAYAALQARLDERRSLLPDLIIVAPQMPEQPSSMESSVWQSYAARLEQFVERLGHRIDAAITEAEKLQLRRLRTRKAWDSNRDLIGRCQHACSVLQSLQAIVHTEQSRVQAPVTHLAADATCEAIEAANDRLGRWLSETNAKITLLRETDTANSAVRTMAREVGSRYEFVDAAKASSLSARLMKERMLAEFDQKLIRILDDLNLTNKKLPLWLSEMIESVRTGQIDGNANDVELQLKRHARAIRDQEQAACMLENPPAVETESDIAEWRKVAGALESVACGLEMLSPTLERKYEKLVTEMQQRLEREHARLAVENALAEVGFTLHHRDEIDLSDDSRDGIIVGMPGFDDHAVLVQLMGNSVSWIPYRRDDRADHAAAVRDVEFDGASCQQLRRAVGGLQTAGERAPIVQLQGKNEHPVLAASAMQKIGVKIRRAVAPGKSAHRTIEPATAFAYKEK